MIKKILSVLLLMTVIITSCASCGDGNETENGNPMDTEPVTNPVTTEEEKPKAVGYSVSTSNELATKVGEKVLENGGNAVDAAIAVAYSLAVVEPYASGLGGGGGMLIYDSKTEKYTFLNYMPEAALSGTVSENIGVPGFVSGMQKAYDMYGSVDFSELLSYAVDYAHKGFIVNELLKKRIDQFSDELGEGYDVYSSARKGFRLKLTELGNTISAISEKGSAEFYSGEIAGKIAGSSMLTKKDLMHYETVVSEPVSSEIDGMKIVSAPSPFSGTMLIQMLKMFSFSDIGNPETNPKAYVSTLVKARQVCGNDRISFSCDPRFSKRNAEYVSHTEDSYVRKLMGKSSVLSGEENESEDTTHVSITDSSGMMVSMTNTVSSFWGSKRFVSGFYLNNSLRNFSSSGINAPEPGKRGRTFISPTIVTEKNGDMFAIGTPGGNVITTTLCEVIGLIGLYNEDPETAIGKMRLAVDNNTVTVETGLKTPLIADPYSGGYPTVSYDHNEYFGSVNLAGITSDGKHFAVADKRRTGSAKSVD